MIDLTMRDTHDLLQPANRRMMFARSITVAAALALSGCGALTGFLGDDEDAPAPAELEAFEPATVINEALEPPGRLRRR